ncbi:uncharacterized protein [Watersipora subatra]|uniref:uncharacterized protein n=1 Tax=Watersipora subatra TaxID=2589382 RepID=UPI00355C35E3
MMTNQHNSTSKKFLYSDGKKTQEEEITFHSKGYHPLGESQKLIDLEKVWSVKDLILDSGLKPVSAELRANASTSYYSRHGQYKSTKETEKSAPSGSSPATWNSKNELNNRKTDNSNSSNPFDF